MKMPIIMDCDPGWDDTIAIIMALSNDKLDVKAVTCVAGNISVKKTTENAKKVLNFMKSNAILAAGAEKPLDYELKTIEDVHGEDGLYGLLENADYEVDKRKADELIKDILLKSNEKITIVATGALTNIALLIKNYPEAISKIERICMMGGGIENGNITKYAEFNFHTDPHAAEIVFNSGIPIIMCGLEASYKAICKKEDVTEVQKIGNKKSELVSKILEEAGKVKRKNRNIKVGDAPLFDPVAVAYLINPSIFKTEKYDIEIVTEGERRGQSKVINNSNKYNAEVVIDVNREEIIKLLIECLKYNNK